MSKLKTTLSQDEIEKLGIWEAATSDGYWEKAANNDIQYIYLLGQLQATKSIHTSLVGNAVSSITRWRIAHLEAEIRKIEKRLLS